MANYVPGVRPNPDDNGHHGIVERADGELVWIGPGRWSRIAAQKDALEVSGLLRRGDPVSIGRLEGSARG